MITGDGFPLNSTDPQYYSKQRLGFVSPFISSCLTTHPPHTPSDSNNDVTDVDSTHAGQPLGKPQITRAALQSATLFCGALTFLVVEDLFKNF